MRPAGPFEREVLREDRRLEPLQLVARDEPELLDQRRAHAPVGLERVGLTAGAVEREHQLSVQLLAVRVLGRQRLELPDDRGVAAEREVDVEPLLQRLEPQLGEPVGLAGAGPSSGASASGGPRNSASAARRSRAAASSSPAARARRARLDERLEAREVEVAGLERDRVPRRVRDDRVAGPERAPQPGHVDLERLGGGRRRLVAPQHVDEARRRDRLLAMGEQQRREQRALLGGLELDRAVRPVDAQRSEDRELHP